MASHPGSRGAASQAGVNTTQHRAAKLFLRIVRAYHMRQYIFPHLTATEAAKLIHATNINHLIGPQERSKVLNPMRNLFTDDELGEIDSQLASDPGRHILVVGRDLDDLYARVGNADKLYSGIPLLLSIVEATVQRNPGRRPSSISPDGSKPRREWRVAPTTDLPGQWSTQHADSHAYFMSKPACEVSEEKQDIRDKGIRLRRRKLEQVDDRFFSAGRRIVFDHLTHKGLMTLLKGNVRQCLGKATREPCVLGLDDTGFPVPVLDDLLFVDLRNPILQKAVNSGRPRGECVSPAQIPQAHIEVELFTYASHVWHIPLGSGDMREPNR